MQPRCDEVFKLPAAGEPHQGAAARPVCRPHLDPPMVDESISGGARGPSLHPARNHASHRTAGHGPCPSAMPNHPTTAFEARCGGDPKHPHRRGKAVQRLSGPSVVPAPGAPAHCRIARSERAVVEKGVPGSPGPVRYARGHRRSSKTLSRDRLNCSEAPSQTISVQSSSGICAAKCPITSKRSKTLLRAISGLIPFDSRLSRYLLLLMKGMKVEVLKLVKTSTHGTCRLPTHNLFSITLPIPPIEVQQRIISKVHDVMNVPDQLSLRLTEQRNAHNTFATSLLHHLNT